ncbi:hypothetical protein PF011_g31765 [Phytophthora fragariae]|uniref:Uncharacterized protein n=1 Tax=Phytophthora fragariae TaxID=53985 RepID=A0A6A3GDW0_9STRA|nr:hypothetical protein PF011_g31765 [Phytophthora fragariae]
MPQSSLGLPMVLNSPREQPSVAEDPVPVDCQPIRWVWHESWETFETF